MTHIDIDDGLFRQLLSDGRSNIEIAEALCISLSKLTKWMGERGYRSAYMTYREKVWARFLTLYTEGRSDREISDITGEHVSTVIAWRRREKLKPIRKLQCDDRLKFWKLGWTDAEIAAEMKTPKRNITMWRTMRKLKCNKHKTLLETKGKQMRLFWNRGLTDAEIADEVGVSRYTVYRWRAQFGYPSHTVR